MSEDRRPDQRLHARLRRWTQEQIDGRLRSDGPEILDDEGLSARGQRILSDLDRWNGLSGWYRQHLQRIRRHWDALGKPQPFCVVDVGCGPGGMLEMLAAWGARYSVDVELTGVDSSPAYLEMARQKLSAAGGKSAVRLVEADAARTPFADGEFHLLTSTLMLHHLPDPVRVALVAEAGRIAESQYIFDLERTLTGVVGWSVLAPALGMGADTRHDGVQSVRRACSLEEFRALMAPLPVSVERAFPTGLFTSPASRRGSPGSG